MYGMYGDEQQQQQSAVQKVERRSEKTVKGSWTAKDIAALKGLHRWKAQVSALSWLLHYAT
jgi:hypothetical protein